MKPANYGPFYAAGLYPKLAEVFRSHGYALAIHGSVANDLDLIAVPWIEDAADPQTVVDECMNRFAFAKVADGYKGEMKPHGRLAFRVPFSFDVCSMDVSFTPRAGDIKGLRAKIQSMKEAGDALHELVTQDRNIFFQGCHNPEGSVDDPADQEILDDYDAVREVWDKVTTEQPSAPTSVEEAPAIRDYTQEEWAAMPCAHLPHSSAEFHAPGTPCPIAKEQPHECPHCGGDDGHWPGCSEIPKAIAKEQP